MEREQRYRLAVSRPAEWYRDHPNADRAVFRILAKMAALELPPPRDRRRSVGDGCPLTVRELQVLGGRAAGLRLAEVAAVLGVGVEAVRSANRAACARLGTTGASRTMHAVAIAIREGWL